MCVASLLLFIITAFRSRSFTSSCLILALVLLIVIFLLFGLDQVPLFLLLDGPLETSVVVAGAVVANHGVPHDLVDGEGPENGDRVVHFVVVANP